MTETLERAAVEQRIAVQPVVDAFMHYCEDHGLERAAGVLAGLINLHRMLESEGKTLQ